MSAARPALLSHVEAPADSRPVLAASFAMLLAGDVSALSLAALSSIFSWVHIGTAFSTEFYVRFWPVLLLFPIAYASAGLYPGFGRHPADELRRMWTAISVVYAALAVTVFLLKDGPTYSRGVFLLAWTQTLILAPLFRSLVRNLCSSRSWWGYSVVLAGTPAATARVAASLRDDRGLGLRPVLMQHQVGAGVETRARCVILSTAGLPREQAAEWFRDCGERFPDVIVLPDLAGFRTLGVEPRDISGVLGLHARQRLLLLGSRTVKRAVDLCAVSAGSLILLPVAAVIAALVKITSPGPLFYRQTRVGRGGRTFTAWKFRSMAVDANRILEDCLARDARLREEWRQQQKLRHDPRITTVGRFLRRSSLDELPQFWNILRGEMSLVGPRPIVEDEIPRYGASFALYRRVTPGLTGLWQVSGRNSVSYEERVNYDAYYIRNWSPWLDLYILARTVTAVLTARGAY